MREILDSILEKIHDPNGSMVDDHFREVCYNLLLKIQKTRAEMHFKPYNLDRIIILVNELHYGALMHKGRIRKDKKPEFYSHLMGTVDNLLEDQHLTGLTSLLSGLKHDDIEDLDLTSKKLFREEIYSDQLMQGSSEYLAKLRQNVHRIVLGLTKVRRDTRKRTKEETFKKLLEFIRDYGIRVGYVKIADRTHNIETLSGHGTQDIEKQKDIASETEKIYIPLSRIFRISDSGAKMLTGCTQLFNPKFFNDFQNLLTKKKKEFLNPYKEKIETLLLNDKDFRKMIYSVNIISQDINSFLETYEINSPISEFSLNNIPVDHHEPLHDIVVLVQNKEHIVPLVGKIIEKFAVGKVDINAKELENNRGMLLWIYNKSFGGRLYFRINTRTHEARSKRGLLAKLDDATVPGLQEAITSFLQKVGKDTNKIFQMAGKELLKPPIIVYSPRDKAIQLNRGATALDFAAKIHEDVLVGAQNAYISDDIWGHHRRPFPLFEELPTGVMVFIDSCLSNLKVRKPDKAEIKVTPGWLLFCHTVARNILSRYLKSKPKLAIEKGNEFFKLVAGICNETPENFLEAIRDYSRKLKHTSKDEIMYSIGIGECDLLNVAGSLTQMQEAKTFAFEVLLHNEPTTLAKFTQKLHPLINIEKAEIDSTQRGVKGKLFIELCFNPERMSVYEFLKEMLKLKYEGYSINISCKDV